mgnify:FL=1
MSISLDKVEQLLQNANFYKDQTQFWEMLDFIATSSTTFSLKSMKQLSVQLYQAIENADNFRVVQLSCESIYYCYFKILKIIRNNKSVQMWMYGEDKNVLTALHNIYKILYTFQTPELPPFGTIQ